MSDTQPDMENLFATVDMQTVVEDGYLVVGVHILNDEHCQDGNGDFSETVGAALLTEVYGDQHSYIHTKKYNRHGFTWDPEDGSSWGEEGAYRGSTAKHGSIWRPDLNEGRWPDGLFVEHNPQFHASFVLDTDRGKWIPPVAQPEGIGFNHWDEEAQEWQKPPEIPASWIWDNEALQWEAPVPFPWEECKITEAEYDWDEDTQTWIAV